MLALEGYRVERLTTKSRRRSGRAQSNLPSLRSMLCPYAFLDFLLRDTTEQQSSRASGHS